MTDKEIGFLAFEKLKVFAKTLEKTDDYSDEVLFALACFSSNNFHRRMAVAKLQSQELLYYIAANYLSEDDGCAVYHAIFERITDLDLLERLIHSSNRNFLISLTYHLPDELLIKLAETTKDAQMKAIVGQKMRSVELVDKYALNSPDRELRRSFIEYASKEAKKKALLSDPYTDLRRDLVKFCDDTELLYHVALRDAEECVRADAAVKLSGKDFPEKMQMLANILLRNFTMYFGKRCVDRLLEAIPSCYLNELAKLCSSIPDLEGRINKAWFDKIESAPRHYSETIRARDLPDGYPYMDEFEYIDSQFD